MYQLIVNSIANQPVAAKKQIDDTTVMSIPFDPANTDYAQFKVDLAEGVTLLDAEGVEMTPEQVQELLETLP